MVKCDKVPLSVTNMLLYVIYQAEREVASKRDKCQSLNITALRTQEILVILGGFNHLYKSATLLSAPAHSVRE